VALLVDDASPGWSEDEAEGLARNVPPDSLLIHRFDENGGVTRSWNWGLAKARELGADYTVVANDDILFTPGWFGALASSLESWDLVGPLTNAPGPPNFWWQNVRLHLNGYRLTDDAGYLDRLAGLLRRLFPEDAVVPAVVNGFFQVAKTSTWWDYAFDAEDVFDPSHRMVGNEEEFQERLRRQGGRTGVVLRSFIFHYRGASRDSHGVGRYRPDDGATPPLSASAPAVSRPPACDDAAESGIAASRALEVACLTPPRHDFLCSCIVQGLRELGHDVVCSTSLYNPEAIETPTFPGLRPICTSADLVLLFSNTGYAQRKQYLFDNHLAGQAIYIDGSDSPSLEDPEAPEMYPVCFKRELPRDCVGRLLPLPFAVEAKYEVYADALERDIDVSCTLRPHNTERESLNDTLRAMGLARAVIGPVSEGGAATASGDERKDEYFRVLARSKMSVSYPGGGWDTGRFWEILGSRALLLSPPVNIAMPYALVDGEHFASYGSPDELVEKVRYYLRHDSVRRAIVRAATQHVHKWHSARARARYLLSKAMGKLRL
jgi:hypothetical protein